MSRLTNIKNISILHIILLLVVVCLLSGCSNTQKKMKSFDLSKYTVVDDIVLKTDKTIYGEKDIYISITIENNLSNSIIYGPDNKLSDGTKGVKVIVEKLIDNEWYYWDNGTGNEIALGKDLYPNETIVYDIAINQYLPSNLDKKGEYRICFPFSYSIDEGNEGSNSKYRDGVSYAYFSIE